MLSKKLLTSAIAVSALSVPAVHAYEAGDIIVRGGAAMVNPNASSSMIYIDSPALGNTGIDDVDVDKDIQLGVTLTYMINESIGVEVLAATPFEHDIELAALNTDIASTKHLPPTVTFNYHLSEPSSKFQPYVGMGINYTVFFDEKVTSALDNAGTFDLLAASTGNLAAGTITSVSNTKIDLDSSMGVAIHLGFDYELTESLGINASYYWIDIDTTAEITTDSNAGQVKASVDVDIDPSVYMLGLSYKF